LIFDDPAVLEKSHRPVMLMVRSGRGPFKPALPRRARAMHEIFFENLRNPARNRPAGLMRQFRSDQLDSTQDTMSAAAAAAAACIPVHACRFMHAAVHPAFTQQ
jgi:hypothetical protein